LSMCTANALRLLQEFLELVPLVKKLVEESIETFSTIF